MALFLGLARSSELVVIRAAGRSAMRMLVEPFWPRCCSARWWWRCSTRSSRHRQRGLYQDRLAALHRPDLAAQVSLDGVGAVAAAGRRGLGQTVIRAGSVDPDGLGFREVSFLVFDGSDGAPVARIEAAVARLGTGAWELSRRSDGI
jgi:lipopolysaccharide export system permease protein